MASLKNHPGMWLRADAAAAINALEDKYGVIRINSAGRTVEEQNDLIRRFDAGEPGIYMPARPAETSLHVKDGGTAVDVYNYTDDRAKLNEFGFEWYGNADKVHYTFKGWGGSGDSAIGATTRLKGSAWVRSVQDKFRRIGHDLGPAGIDGIDGPRFVEIAKWEQRNGGLVQDGIVGDVTNAYLDRVLTPAPSYPRDSFAEYQAALNKFGYGLVVDDIWGPKSSNALAHFQASRGLVVDRMVGPRTRAALGI